MHINAAEETQDKSFYKQDNTVQKEKRYELYALYNIVLHNLNKSAFEGLFSMDCY